MGVALETAGLRRQRRPMCHHAHSQLPPGLPIVHQPSLQPELNDQTTTTIPSSSPFRVALRPRHQSYSLTAPTPQQQHQSTNMPPSGRPQGHLMPYTQQFTNQHRHHRHGRLTSALLGFVDTIDNLATSHHQPTAAPGAMQVQQPTTPAVPTLHRSDRGLGGIGRASERQQNGSSEDAGENAAMSSEESSLATAKEFLSRLLLILACFVILCLLLF